MCSRKPIAGTLGRALGVAVLVAACGGAALPSKAAADANADEATGPAELPFLDPDAPDYRTPRAGEGFRTRLFGRVVTVEPRDRRTLTALALGVAANAPGAERGGVAPIGSVYLWRHPDEDRLFSAVLAGLYDEIDAMRAVRRASPIHLVLRFSNLTLPFDRAEWADGEWLEDEELEWGSVRGAVGLGYVRQVAPGAQDNLFALSLTAEPGFLYFHRGEDAAPGFEEPSESFELRGRLRLRWDAMERNVLELPHRGFALGGDAVLTHRTSWRDWGLSGGEDAARGRTPRLLEAYLVGAGGLPGAGERHRLVGSIHAGVGANLDRFSAPHLGGGPTGSDFTSLARVVVPGAALAELAPRHHYAVAIAEYRYELAFSTYLGLRAALAWLDRWRLDRVGGAERLRRENDFLPSAGARLTTGFLFESRLQLDYAYGFGVIRDGRRGAHEIVVQISRRF